MKRLSFMPFGLVLSVLVAAMLGGCIDERYTENAPSGDEVQLLVELNVPGVSTAAVRGLSNITEKQIDKLDVLVFDVDATTEEETFAYKTHGVLESGKYKVTIKKSSGSEKYRFVFLANLRDELTAAMTTSTFDATTSKEAALAAITFEAFLSGTPASWDTGTPPRNLPMWGESTNTHIVNDGLQSIGTVYMLRSVARVDILFKPASNSTTEEPRASGFDNLFVVKKVEVRNVSRIGVAAPKEGNVNGIGTSSMAAHLPTVPDPSTLSTGDIDNITHFEYTNTAKNEFVREIYIAESANTNDGTSNIAAESEMTYLLIGGEYDGGSTTWYRLDFINPTTGLRWDILRNYCYTFKITSITGPGYASPEEALGSRPVNLEYNMTVSNESVNESAIKEVVFNGQYMLGVSQKSYSLSFEWRTIRNDDNMLYIKTNYTGGWTVTSDRDWLRLINATTGEPITGGTVNDASNPITNVKLGLDINTAKTERTGNLRISLANGLSMNIAVRQGEITVKDGNENCYMTLRDRSVAFYVSRPKEYNSALPTTTTFTVDKLWDDPLNSGIAYYTIVEDTTYPYIVVTGGLSSGNGGIAAKIGDDICWSYHIWVTDYTGAETWANNGFTFMDRNLGATAATNSLAGRGLYYQWGRKDPFPGSLSGMAGFAALSAFKGITASGNSAKVTIPYATTAAGVLEAIKTPTTFYIHYDTDNNWLPEFDTAANALWGATKTIHDPCPKDWRVPTNGTGTASPWYGLAAVTYERGATAGLTWGNNAWPAGGTRKYDDGSGYNVGTAGYYWSASLVGGTSKNAYYMFFDSYSNFSPSHNLLYGARSSGNSVRCVKIP